MLRCVRIRFECGCRLSNFRKMGFYSRLLIRDFVSWRSKDVNLPLRASVTPRALVPPCRRKLKNSAEDRPIFNLLRTSTISVTLLVRYADRHPTYNSTTYNSTNDGASRALLYYTWCIILGSRAARTSYLIGVSWGVLIALYVCFGRNSVDCRPLSLREQGVSGVCCVLVLLAVRVHNKEG